MRASLGLLGIATFVACSTYGETSSAPPPATSDDGGDGGGGAVNDASSPEASADGGPGGAFCASQGTKKLCDDFEGRTTPAAKWSGITAEGIPTTALAIVGEEDPWGSAFLRVTVPAITSPAGGWSYLVHRIAAAPASLTVGLTVRTTGLTGPNDYVEILNITETTTTRAIALYIEGGVMSAGGKDTTPQLSVGEPKVRTRYEISLVGAMLTVRDANGGKLGEATSAGGAFSGALVVGLGVPYSDPTPGGTIEIDDVVIDY